MKGFNLKLLGLIILLVFSLQNNLFSQTYPTSYGNIATFDHITNVSFAGINNSSGGTSGYYNYTTGTHASLTKGQSYNLDVTIAFDGPEYVKVWIDWNGDKDFADAGEEYVVADAVTNSGPHTVSISVPMGASTGTTRMRVSLREFAAPTSNGIWMFGEVEDYSVDITAVVGQSDMLYYVSNTDDNLYSIDRTNGDCALLGATGKNNIEAIAMWPFPSNRKLYAVDAGDFGYLNKSTGAFTLIGEVDGGGTANGANGPQSLNDVDGLAFDPLTGKLWATERKSGTGVNDLLFQINPATGLFVSNAFGAGIDYFSINSGSVYYDLDDISFNSSGNLYAINNNGTSDQLIKINKFTGSVTIVAALANNNVNGLAGHNDGTFWACEGDDNRFSQINPTTGVMTQVKIPMLGAGDPEAIAALVCDANTLSGRVFDDDNENGVDDSETAIAGVTVNLYNDVNANQILDVSDISLQTTVTDANGEYVFYVATTGNYLTTIIELSLPSGFSLTTDNIEAAAFTDAVNFGENSTQNDFGAKFGYDFDDDGIPDVTEGTIDTDGDGIQNRYDLDSDNDGILDAVEETVDTDGDGVPNYLDYDSDNDGIPDAVEAYSGAFYSGYSSTYGILLGTDTDCDGLLDHIDKAPNVTYTSGSTSKLPNPDTDHDGLYDAIDLDSDNDGILDNIEAGGSDSDCDGMVDNFTDANGDGYHDALTTTPLPITNTDALSYENTYGHSLKPNYIDLDSDADGIDDTKEGLATCGIDLPCYSIPSQITDNDNDGIINHWDITNGGNCIMPYDKESDGIPDYIDTDTDDDGFPDVVEGNDANNDNNADYPPSGDDDDGNGIDDAFDNYCGTIMYACGTNVPTQDKDFDGEDDWRDTETDPGGPLKIELLSFTASANSNMVDLNWATASEENNDYFTIERSKDGQNFVPLTIVDGAGNSNQIIKYFTMDEHPFNGVSYYRLKQTDFDGELSYSQIVSVNIADYFKEINMFPNPVSGDIVTLEIKGYNESEISMNITNNLGVLIYKRSIQGKGNSKLELPIKDIVKSSGVFIITIISDDSIITKKLIIN